MDNSGLRAHLDLLATSAFPSAGSAPAAVLQRAKRGQRWVGVAAIGLASILLTSAVFLLVSSRDLVGPAPMADGPSGGVVNPPDQAFSSGFGLTAVMAEGRICAIFEFASFDGEDHQASERICDPDPDETLSLETRSLDVDDSLEPSGVIVVAAGVEPEVGRVEVDLPGRRLPMQELPILSLADEPRRIAATALGYELFLDRNGEFTATLRTYDQEGALISERELCDPRNETNHCGDQGTRKA